MTSEIPLVNPPGTFSCGLFFAGIFITSLYRFIHTFVEGWFVVTNQTIAGDHYFLSNLWKEYAKSDSRYMTSDPA
jgi:hypothetical protein